MADQNPFSWECQPKAEAIILNILNECCRENPFIGDLQENLLKHTSTRLFDWLDHVVVGSSTTMETNLTNAGFISCHATSTYRIFHHLGAQLPKVVVNDEGRPTVGIAVKVESIADFLMVRGMSGWIEGNTFSPYRKCLVSSENDIFLWVVERRTGYTMEPVYPDNDYTEKYLTGVEMWQARPRDLEDEEEAMMQTMGLADELISMLGIDLASWVVLECERKYWQAKNTAGQIQKNRQDRVGLGWANHDHHTFRSSRRHFFKLVRLFEMLGFHCRERFYAGEEAGWGAQVMENSQSGLTLFLDLDLSPEEIQIDFAHQPLPELKGLGTVGLWCSLHGDSILKGGMHHLEAQFMFENLTHDMQEHGISMMDPFSNFPYLKQAFTHGEIWQVDPRRVTKLVEKGQISYEEADKFLKYGAVGSHLENLQRREGYKGFNQKNVSTIIKKTDPRKMAYTEG